MSTKDKIRDILAADAKASFADIALSVGVSRQRVHQVAAALGHPLRRGNAAAKSRPEYKCWHNMVARCTDPEHRMWGHYGGRGIRVCDRWMRSFDAFLGDMGTKPSPAHSIDRSDNNGHYEPRNCRWATKAEQARNTRMFHAARAPVAPSSEEDMATVNVKLSSRDKGASKGRIPPSESKRRKMQFLRDGGASLKQIAAEMKCSAGTVRNWTSPPPSKK